MNSVVRLMWFCKSEEACRYTGFVSLLSGTSGQRGSREGPVAGQITKEWEQAGPPPVFILSQFVFLGKSTKEEVCRLVDYMETIVLSPQPCSPKPSLCWLGISVHTYERDAQRILYPFSASWLYATLEMELDRGGGHRVRLSTGPVSELACPI